MDVRALQATTKGLFPATLGVTFLAASTDLVKAEMLVREDLCTTPGVMHGGAIMAFADTLGAYGAALNLPAGATTTTIESKTSFFATAPSAAKIVGESVPLHRGKRTTVWQTRVTREDGRLVALVTQTQIVLERERPLQEALAARFATGPALEQQGLLASLERAGGGLYRRWADAEPAGSTRAALLEAAEREDQNAEVLERLVKERS
jgi:uncharacterized protein (TIGR00369 family)